MDDSLLSCVSSPAITFIKTKILPTVTPSSAIGGEESGGAESEIERINRILIQQSRADRPSNDLGYINDKFLSAIYFVSSHFFICMLDLSVLNHLHCFEGKDKFLI